MKSTVQCSKLFRIILKEVSTWQIVSFLLVLSFFFQNLFEDSCHFFISRIPFVAWSEPTKCLVVKEDGILPVFLFPRVKQIPLEEVLYDLFFASSCLFLVDSCIIPDIHPMAHKLDTSIYEFCFPFSKMLIILISVFGSVIWLWSRQFPLDFVVCVSQLMYLSLINVKKFVWL